MTKYSLVNYSVTGEPIELTQLNAKTDRGARRLASRWLKEHEPVDGIVKVGYFRSEDGMQGALEI